jgi:ABC-type bacteriocin/lantibiotic exporter with double-glycine peptidase domain
MLLPDNPEPVTEVWISKSSAFLRKPDLKIRSDTEIWLLSLVCGIFTFLGTLALQWIIYDRFLHQDGLRLVGSVISGIFAAALVHAMSLRTRHSRLAELRRLESIALMNHHIRNALQAIVLCSGTSESAEIIRESVNRIEWALSDIVPGTEDDLKSPESAKD